MTVKAVKGFSGFTSSGERFAMFPGEVREIKESDTVRELLRIGYLENSEFGMRNSELNELPEDSAPDKAEDNTEDMPEKTEGLNETKRGKSTRN